MLCIPTSHYPNGIDTPLFFQDNDIEHIEIINQYKKLISQGKYTEASAYINQQDGIHGYFADFFNAIENRIYNLQDYLLSLPPKVQPFVYYNEVDEDGNELEPNDDMLFEDMIWI